MNKRVSKSKLGRTKSHREALVRNQMRSLFTNGFLVTTTVKAKVLKQKTESFLYKIETESLVNTRLMHTVLGKDELVKRAFEYVKSGEKKVSTVKVSFRSGDSAETSKIMLVGFDTLFGKKKTKSKGKKASKKQEAAETSEKQRERIEAKAKSEKKGLNLRDRFIKKERAKTRSGI